MKKIFLFLLLIPISINAKSLNATIECKEDLEINSKINCNLIIDNPNKTKINSISFDNNSDLLELKSAFNINNENEIYKLDLDSKEETIQVINFNILMFKNNIDIILNNLEINTIYGSYKIPKVEKNLKIGNIAYADNILINNQPLADMNRDIFNYTVDLNELSDYIEVKVITSGSNKTEDKIKLIKFNPSSTLNIKVDNEFDSETYVITFNYKKLKNTNTISIKEIPFEFNPYKSYYYFEVEHNVNKLTFENNGVSNVYNLNNSKNTIIIDNDGKKYAFVIKKLKSNETINTSSSLKTLKIGNTFLNLKDNVYEYNYVSNKVDIATIETINNQDYEIKYNNDKILITVYDAKLNKSNYKVNIISEIEENVEIREYDNTKSIIIFLIFLFLFILLVITLLIKRKKERID